MRLGRWNNKTWSQCTECGNWESQKGSKFCRKCKGDLVLWESGKGGNKQTSDAASSTGGACAKPAKGFRFLEECDMEGLDGAAKQFLKYFESCTQQEFETPRPLTRPSKACRPSSTAGRARSQL